MFQPNKKSNLCLTLYSAEYNYAAIRLQFSPRTPNPSFSKNALKDAFVSGEGTPGFDF